MKATNTNTTKETIRLSLDVSPELNQLLDKLAERTHETKSNVLRKAIVLMDIATRASQEGKRLLVEDPAPGNDERSTTEIIGLIPPLAARVHELNDSPHERAIESLMGMSPHERAIESLMGMSPHERAIESLMGMRTTRSIDVPAGERPGRVYKEGTPLDRETIEAFIEAGELDQLLKVIESPIRHAMSTSAVRHQH